MKIIWAPWRAKYISEIKKTKNCFICEAVKSTNDKESLVIFRGKLTIAIMNKYPYNTGHMMVSPIRHIKFPYEMTKEEMTEAMALLAKMTKVLENIYSPEGINIGVNIGKSAGAGEDHLHFHIVPRWHGDTNFMSVLADTRVLPSTLETTYLKIKKELENSET
jgi:ATP adenylyltransferase